MSAFRRANVSREEIGHHPAEYIFVNGKRYVTVEHMADQMLMAFETGKRAALSRHCPSNVATTPEHMA